MTQWVWGDHWQLVIPADAHSRENDKEREREREEFGPPLYVV